jgi:hypothetical protein
VFGISKRAPIGAAVMIAFSAVGALIALTFANTRGKSQESKCSIMYSFIDEI